MRVNEKHVHIYVYSNYILPQSIILHTQYRNACNSPSGCVRICRKWKHKRVRVLLNWMCRSARRRTLLPSFRRGPRALRSSRPARSQLSSPGSRRRRGRQNPSIRKDPPRRARGDGRRSVTRGPAQTHPPSHANHTGKKLAWKRGSGNGLASHVVCHSQAAAAYARLPRIRAFSIHAKQPKNVSTQRRPPPSTQQRNNKKPPRFFDNTQACGLCFLHAAAAVARRPRRCDGDDGQKSLERDGSGPPNTNLPLSPRLAIPNIPMHNVPAKCSAVAPAKRTHRLLHARTHTRSAVAFFLTLP